MYVPDASRDLPRYPLDSAVQVEHTHIDRDVEARARAMTSQATQVTSPPVAAPRLDLPKRFELEEPNEALSGLGAAMLVRVRFAGGEVPLWSLIAPLVIVAAIAAAFAASAASRARVESSVESSLVASAAAPATADAPAAIESPKAAPAPTPSAPAAADAPDATPDTAAAPTGSVPLAALAPSAAPLDVEPGRHAARELIALAEKGASRERDAARKLERALDRDPGLIKEERVLGSLRHFADNAETARVALGTIAALPAPLGADLLYEVWTGTVQRNETTDLARALLYSKDVRPKASPALSVALDLRVAESCEQNRAILPRAVQHADRRSLHLLTKLQRRYGCGANKRQDCFTCLRKGDELEQSIKVAKERKEPKSFSRR